VKRGIRCTLCALSAEKKIVMNLSLHVCVMHSFMPLMFSCEISNPVTVFIHILSHLN
jgi:hypothetical protein